MKIGRKLPKFTSNWSSLAEKAKENVKSRLWSVLGDRKRRRKWRSGSGQSFKSSSFQEDFFKGLQPKPSVQDDPSDAWPPQQCVTWPRSPPPGTPWCSPRVLLQNKEKRTKLIQSFGLFKGLQPQPSVQGDLSDAWPPQQCVTWPRTPPPSPPWSSPKGLLQNREKDQINTVIWPF